MRVTLIDEGAPRGLSEQNRREGERLSESELCEERKNDDGLFGDKQNSEHTVFAPLILCLIPVEKMLCSSEKPACVLADSKQPILQDNVNVITISIYQLFACQESFRGFSDVLSAFILPVC